jgi:hypothetical protein
MSKTRAKKHNKQREVTAATFKRLARNYRIDAKSWQVPFRQFLEGIADRLDEEAKLLRSMR